MSNFKMHWLVELFIGNRSKLTTVDLTMNGCTQLKDALKNKVMQYQMRIIRKFLNTPLECPLKSVNIGIFS